MAKKSKATEKLESASTPLPVKQAAAERMFTEADGKGQPTTAEIEQNILNRTVRGY